MQLLKKFGILDEVRINRSSLLVETEVRNKSPEGTRLILYHNKFERGDMKSNNLNIETNRVFGSIGAQARLLMSQNLHKQNNRQQAMLQRAAEEVGISS